MNKTRQELNADSLAILLENKELLKKHRLRRGVAGAFLSSIFPEIEKMLLLGFSKQLIYENLLAQKKIPDFISYHVFLNFLKKKNNQEVSL